MSAIDSMHDKQRPFNGQPHTDFGERGEQIVEGVRMRDVMDAIARGFLLSTGPSELYAKVQEGRATYADLFQMSRAELGSLDPMAIIQNALCEIEKDMGIFPNIPPLEGEPPWEKME